MEQKEKLNKRAIFAGQNRFCYSHTPHDGKKCWLKEGMSGCNPGIWLFKILDVKTTAYLALLNKAKNQCIECMYSWNASTPPHHIENL